MRLRTWTIIGVPIIALALATAGCSATAGSNANNGGNPVANLSLLAEAFQQNGISVSGQGEVKAVPDVAILSLGIEARATTVTEAQQQARTAMDAVLKALKSNGVKDADIQTQRFSISPQIQWLDKENRQQIIGYIVDNLVTAKVRNLPDAGPVVDAAAQAGGDLIRINGINFTIEDPSALQAQAEQLALKNAKAKAKATADTLGVTLGKLVSAQLNNYAQPAPVPMYNAKGASAGMSAPDTSINPGTLTISATASTVWAIQ